jgi:hypothetical protein
MSSPAYPTTWGVDQYSAKDGQMAALERAMGRPFGSWSVYRGLDEATQYVDVVGPALEAGKLIYLNITSSHRDGPLKLPYCWAGIAAGDHDTLLTAWASAIVAGGHQDQLVITFEHEPLERGDRGTQPKCPSDDAVSYRAAFVHVKRWLHYRGVTARFAFVATAGNYAAANAGWTGLAPYVPWGYFSIIGVDVYNRVDDWKGVGVKVNALARWRQDHPVAGAMDVIVPELGVDSRHPEAPEWITRAAADLQTVYGAALLAVNWNLKAPYGPHDQATKEAWLGASRSWP